MISVTLNDYEIKICNDLARTRYSNNRKVGIKDRKIGPQDAIDAEINSLGAEIALAKAMNIYPDFSIYPRKKGVDLISSNLTRIDVKHTKYKNGKLLATLNKEIKDTDVYVLVIGEIPNYNIIGWCSSKELINEENIINLGHGNGYALDQDNLKCWDFSFPGIIDDTRNLNGN